MVAVTIMSICGCVANSGSMRAKGITATDIAKMLGVSRATVYRYLNDAVSLSA